MEEVTERISTLHMTAANVAYHRRGALTKLRALLEARNYEKKKIYLTARSVPVYRVMRRP